MPVLGFTALVGLIAMGLVLVYGFSAVVLFFTVEYAKGLSLSLAMFLGIFFALIGIISGFFVLFGLFSITVFGVASIALKGTGAGAAVTETVDYLFRRPSAFWLYVVLAFLYLLLSLILSLPGFALRALPIIGWILSFPYQIVVYALEGYAVYLLLSVSFVYFYRTAIQDGGKATVGKSTPRTDTSLSEDGGQVPLPPRIDLK
jgi:hypothetical protein